MVGVVGVEGVGEAIHKFQLGTELEKGKVKVAAYTQLGIEVVTFQFEIVIVAAGEVDHRVKACHEVRTVIVEAGSSDDQVDGVGDVRSLHVLMFLGGLAIDIHVGVIAEGEMAVAKIHGRGNTQLQVGVQTQLAQHAYVETIVPAILVARYMLLCHRAVFHLHYLWADVDQLDVLEVGTHMHAEMKLAQVNIRPVLYSARLREQAEDGECP